MELVHMFPLALPKYNWTPVDGVADTDLNSWNKSLDNIAQLLLLNAATMGRSVTLDWAANKLPNWQKFWSGAAGTGNLIKQIDYTWSEMFCQTEQYTFYDYSETGTLLRTRQCLVTYTWDENNLCTGIDVGLIT